MFVTIPSRYGVNRVKNGSLPPCVTYPGRTYRQEQARTGDTETRGNANFETDSEKVRTLVRVGKAGRGNFSSQNEAEKGTMFGLSWKDS